VDPTFEVIRFQVAPAGGAVAVIELEGRPAAGQVHNGRPVLLLEGPVEQLELRAIVEPDSDADGVLRASFAAPLELAVDAATTFALAIGRGPLLELPPPDGVGEAGLEVRLARTVNRLRGELHDARSRLGAEVGEVRDRLEEQGQRAARELAAEREGAAAERAAAAQTAAALAATAERERADAELADAHAEIDGLRDELAEAHRRIAALEAAAAPRPQRTPRPARPHHPRPPRHEDGTAEHEPAVRSNHSSLGRSTARTVVLIVLALLLAALLVVVLQVRVV
jgi:hypothetical protein